MNAEGKKFAWEHSYVADDRTFCIYDTDSASLIDEHARRSGLPATKVTVIFKAISPATDDG